MEGGIIYHVQSDVIQEQGSWYKSRWMGRGASRDMQRNICFTLRWRRFQRYRYSMRDTEHTSVQRRSRCHCAVSFFHPHKSGHKAVAVGGLKGQSPRVADTHTHQNTSSVLQIMVYDFCAKHMHKTQVYIYCFIILFVLLYK